MRVPIPLVVAFALISCDEQKSTIMEVVEASDERISSPEGFESVQSSEADEAADSLWKNHAELGGAMGMGGRTYFEVNYTSNELGVRRALASDLHGYLRDAWVGQQEFQKLGHVRYRDCAAMILADLTGRTFYVDTSEHRYERDKRIVGLLQELDAKGPNALDRLVGE